MLKYVIWLMTFCLPLCCMDKKEFKYYKQKTWYATNYIVCYFLEDQKAGSIECFQLPNYAYILHNLYVKPEYRNQGIGRELLGKAYWILRLKGACKMYIQPGPFEIKDDIVEHISDKQEYNDKMQKLIALYTSVGFKPVGLLDYCGISIFYALLKIPHDAKQIMVKT